MQSTPASELHPAAIADLIDRLEDVACLLAWKLPEARDCEHFMALELGRMRALEAASVIATLAEMARPALNGNGATESKNEDPGRCPAARDPALALSKETLGHYRLAPNVGSTCFPGPKAP